MLINFLLGVTELTKYANFDKYLYSGYSISFDVCGTFPLPNGGFIKNVIILRANMSSSMHEDN